MNDAQTEAIRYLSPSNDSLWRWTTDGDAVAWADGATIAFRQEVDTVIERLAPGGLPRFGSIVLLLAACRDGWEESSGRRTVEGFARAFARWQPNADSNVAVGGPQQVFALVSHSIRSTLRQLDLVSGLRTDVRQGSLAKSILAETVFEPGKKHLTPEQAGTVVAALAVGVNPAALVAGFESEESLSQFARDCESLQPGLGMVDADALALRARTGLDEIILPADVKLSAAERTCQLLAELLHDREFAGLARLAQRLMAAVHVPRSLHAREELPVGGVSDLSNRGSLDRLLVSELANDSLTLAVRVALNEALYLRRESPPHDPPHRRALLLDCGIRLWGIPRVFAVAVAMAFAATTDHAAELSAFRAAGKKTELLDLTTRNGLVSCMAALDAWPHPGQSVEPFLKAVLDARAEPADPILITHPDVLSDPEFSAALARFAVDLLYVATVDREGNFQMFAITPGGRKRVSDAQLDLQGLFAQEAAPTKVLTSSSPFPLPAIWAMDRFPLRLPCIVKPRRAIATDELGLLAVSGDGRFLHWKTHSKHARQLAHALPRQALLGLYHQSAFRSVIAVFANRSGRRACFVRSKLSTGKTKTIELTLQGPSALGCCIVGAVLCLISGERVEAFDLTDGSPITSLLLKDKIRWNRDRFFEGPSGWYALAYSGKELQLESLVPGVGRAILVADAGVPEGPLAISNNGSVVARADGEPLIRAQFVAASALGVSADGSRIAIRAEGKAYVLDLEVGTEWKVAERPWAEFLVGPQFSWAANFPAMGPSRYHGIHVNEKREMCLVSAKGQEWRLTSDRLGKFVLSGPFEMTKGCKLNLFKPVDLRDGARIQLSMARWADGSYVFSDSRRLLHLKSPDASLPEVTLVLCVGLLAAWSSDGRLFGPKPFLPEGDVAPNEELVEIVRQFVLRLR